MGRSTSVRASRDGMRKAKVQLELNLVKKIMDNKKDFCKYVICKRRTMGNMGLLLNEVDVLVTGNRRQRY